ncbi:MAG: hypothetical protein ACREYF_13350, partial [Gammaproteobacteria bacterium]
PVRPTASALVAWAHKRAVIIEEIRLGQFEWGRWFPWAPPPPELSACRPYASAGTIADLLNGWLKRCERELETTSWRKCRQVIDSVLIPTFGAIPAERLVPGDIQDWIAGHELTRKTTSNYLWPLRRALHQAVHVDRTLESDPLVNYRVPRRRIDRRVMRSACATPIRFSMPRSKQHWPWRSPIWCPLSCSIFGPG